MRAKEFIVERKGGKMSRVHQQSTRGVNKFTDLDRWNSDYKLYRLGLALAGTDGKDIKDMDDESWVGRFKTLHPYSEVEQDMIDLAAKMVGVKIDDVNGGDMRSQELSSTNTVSPVSNWNKK
jgi:L-alanine-DL-glutamate epimerase-like enolase superfamily enzyme